jgi:hypothetical protein
VVFFPAIGSNMVNSFSGHFFYFAFFFGAVKSGDVPFSFCRGNLEYPSVCDAQEGPLGEFAVP